MKIAFHIFLLISLFEQQPKCKSLGSILFLPLLKIGEWPFWMKFERFDREINIEHK